MTNLKGKNTYRLMRNSFSGYWNEQKNWPDDWQIQQAGGGELEEERKILESYYKRRATRNYKNAATKKIHP